MAFGDLDATLLDDQPLTADGTARSRRGLGGACTGAAKSFTATAESDVAYAATVSGWFRRQRALLPCQHPQEIHGSGDVTSACRLVLTGTGVAVAATCAASCRTDASGRRARCSNRWLHLALLRQRWRRCHAAERCLRLHCACLRCRSCLGRSCAYRGHLGIHCRIACVHGPCVLPLKLVQQLRAATCAEAAGITASLL